MIDLKALLVINSITTNFLNKILATNSKTIICRPQHNNLSPLMGFEIWGLKYGNYNCGNSQKI
jgi:hypothetical protein